MTSLFAILNLFSFSLQREVLEFSRDSPKVRRIFGWQLMKFRSKFQRFFVWNKERISSNFVYILFAQYCNYHNDSWFSATYKTDYIIISLQLTTDQIIIGIGNDDGGWSSYF